MKPAIDSNISIIPMPGKGLLPPGAMTNSHRSMKTRILLSALFCLAWLPGCEKNDPLADQGELTGTVVPFNLLAQMPDAAPGDTLILRTVCWAVDDNLATVDFYHRGFKQRNYDVKMMVNAAGGVSRELRAQFAGDTLFFSRTHIAQYPQSGQSLTDYYQTLENAYVILHDFVVPGDYALSRERNQDLIMAMNDADYERLVDGFTGQFDRPATVQVFPGINPFSLTYFRVDAQGFFTGELTDEGRQYIRNNLSREIMIEFLKEAMVSDNTRVTMESVATLDVNDAHTSSTRVFRVL